MQYTLAGTIEAILTLCKPLNSESANRRRADIEWTVSEVVEHLAIVERATLVGLKRTLSQSPADPEKLKATEGKSEIISNRVGVAVNRIQAPAVAQPGGKFGPWPAPLNQLVETRQKLMEFEATDAPGFDTHLMDHPVLGPMTVRQWLQFIAAHTNRHLIQIESLLASG
ncbi:MAG: DinB family protein [Acidobacteria bacterium]|nr:DinB family protein [Acidobacteriota bacterium]